MSREENERDFNQCHNPDWDQAKETIFEFADRMVIDRKWIPMIYTLRPALRGRYPNLRVDEDSVLWENRRTWKRGGFEKDRTEITYISTAENHLLILTNMKETGVLTKAEHDFAVKVVLSKIDGDEARAAIRRLLRKKVLTDKESAVTHSTGGIDAKGEEREEEGRQAAEECPAR